MLLLHLTRFDFDLETGEMAKVLSKWEYEEELDLGQFLSMKDGLKPAVADTTYQLHSVLVHAGVDARRGHYFCYVRDVAMVHGINSTMNLSVWQRSTKFFRRTLAALLTTTGVESTALHKRIFACVHPEVDARHIDAEGMPEAIPQHIVEQLEHEAAEAEVAKNIDPRPICLVNSVFLLRRHFRTLHTLVTCCTTATISVSQDAACEVNGECKDHIDAVCKGTLL